MDVMTFFVGIIAFCMVVLTVMVVIFLLSVSRSLKAVDEKVALLVFELSQILPNIRKTTQNIADMSGVLNIFSFFKKTK
ncbi:MAG: hypothetical protein JHC37_01710 [Campylobacteraceae bacterium]|jgi:uncharacterized protein YoxC|nr:hypothetical protein [Campylobacteraceae bacterium]